MSRQGGILKLSILVVEVDIQMLLYEVHHERHLGWKVIQFDLGAGAPDLVTFWRVFYQNFVEGLGLLCQAMVTECYGEVRWHLECAYVVHAVNCILRYGKVPDKLIFFAIINHLCF